MKIKPLLEIIPLRTLNFRIISSNINSINPVESIILVVKIYYNIFIYLSITIRTVL